MAADGTTPNTADNGEQEQEAPPNDVTSGIGGEGSPNISQSKDDANDSDKMKHLSNKSTQLAIEKQLRGAIIDSQHPGIGSPVFKLPPPPPKINPESSILLSRMDTLERRMDNIEECLKLLISGQSMVITSMEEISKLTVTVEHLHNEVANLGAKMTSRPFTPPVQQTPLVTDVLPSGGALSTQSQSSPGSAANSQVFGSYYDENLSNLKMTGLTREVWIQAQLMGGLWPWIQKYYPSHSLPEATVDMYYKTGELPLLAAIDREINRQKSSSHKNTYIPLDKAMIQPAPSQYAAGYGMPPTIQPSTSQQASDIMSSLAKWANETQKPY